MEFFPRPAADVQTQGAVLVACSPAIGNVGQLAVDLLVENHNAQNVAVLESSNVLPVVGNDAYTARRSDQGEEPSSSRCAGVLSTTLELFASTSGADGQRVFLLQQRGPVVTGRQRAFADELTNWASACGFGRVVILSSLDAAYRQDRQITGQQVCFVTTDGCRDAAEALVAASYAPCGGNDEFDGKAVQDRRSAPWPLYVACVAKNVPCVALMAFASEGQNIPDAVKLADAACVLLPALRRPLLDVGQQPSWRFPPSWGRLLQAAA